MLVAGTAAFLVAVGLVLVDQFATRAGRDVTGADPIRIVQAVIVGVSVLATGTIVRSRRGGGVHG